MAVVLIILLTGAMIVAVMVFVTPMVSIIPISDHNKGLLLLAVKFAGCGVIFGIYYGYGIMFGVIDSLAFFVIFVVLGWLWRRIIRQA